MTTTFLANNKYQIDGGTYWVQDAGDSYSLQQTGADTYRFEVRGGDVWSVDPSTKNRSEIASTQVVANSTPINISYNMTVESGAANTASWLVLGQLAAANAPSGSPPFSINLNGEKMAINIGYTNSQGVATYMTVYSDTANIVRGHDYSINIGVTFDPNGNGHLVVTRDGIKLVDYTGPLGFSTQQGVYWKEGIYRAASSETMAVDYSNLSVTTGTAVAASTTNSSSQVVNQYGNDGSLVSSTTKTYDTTGALVKSTTLNADGSKEVLSYKITGQSYVSTDTVYNAAGQVTKLIRYHADGTLDYSQVVAQGTTTSSYYTAAGVLSQLIVVNSDGSKTVKNLGVTGQTYVSETGVYDSTGHLTSLTRYHADGSVDFSQSIVNGVTTNAYFGAAGALTQIDILNANGTKTVKDFGILNHSYVSETGVYDSTGHLTSLTRLHANGTTDFSQTILNGVTTSNYYDATGKLTQIDIFNANGSQTIKHYGVTGQSYVSDTETYDTAGHLTSMVRYHADGTTDYSQLVANGVTTSSFFDVTGKLTQLDTVSANGSKVIKNFGIIGQTYVSDTENYDTFGHLTSMTRYHADGTTDYSQVVTNGVTVSSFFDAKGTLTQLDTVNANGSKIIKDFGITGQTYTSDIENFDSSGHLTSLTRYHADGTADYSQVVANGVTTSSFFNATGKLIQLDTVGSDGSKVIKNFGITGQTYTSDTENYDSSGHLTSLTRMHANGTVDSTIVRGTDGSLTTSLFDANGGFTQSTVLKTDGSTIVKLAAINLTATSASNDTFTSFHNDTFAFKPNFGNDVINGFNAGNGSTHDTIQLSASVVPDFQHLNITQVGADAVIHVSAVDTITLKGVAAAALTAHDFYFH